MLVSLCLNPDFLKIIWLSFLKQLIKLSTFYNGEPTECLLLIFWSSEQLFICHKGKVQALPCLPPTGWKTWSCHKKHLPPYGDDLEACCSGKPTLLLPWCHWALYPGFTRVISPNSGPWLTYLCAPCINILTGREEEWDSSVVVKTTVTLSCGGWITGRWDQVNFLGFI